MWIGWFNVKIGSRWWIWIKMCDFRCQIRWLASKSQVTSVGQLFSKLKEKNVEFRTKPFKESFAGSPHRFTTRIGASWRLLAKFFHGSHVSDVLQLKVFLSTSIRTLLLGWECWLASLGGNVAVNDKPWWWARANVPGRKQAWSKDKVFLFDLVWVQDNKKPLPFFFHQYN